MILELVDFQILAAALFCLGLYGVLARRSAVMVLMAVELMLNAVNINLVAFGVMHNVVAGQVFALFIIAVAAAEVGLALAVIMRLYRRRGTVNVDEIDLMKG
jgi:NADH:ubiquinone oxidoreductase subunit K